MTADDLVVGDRQLGRKPHVLVCHSSVYGIDSAQLSVHLLQPVVRNSMVGLFELLNFRSRQHPTRHPQQPVFVNRHIGHARVHLADQSDVQPAETAGRSRAGKVCPQLLPQALVGKGPGTHCKTASLTPERAGELRNAADAFVMEIVGRIRRGVIIRAILVRVKQSDRYIQPLDCRQHIHARRVAERKNEQQIDFGAKEHFTRLRRLLRCIYQLRCDDFSQRVQQFPQLAIHAQTHRLEPGELLPIVVVPGRQQANSCSRSFGHHRTLQLLALG